MAKYIWYPSLPYEKIREKLSLLFENTSHKKPLEIANDLLDIALRKIDQHNINYLEVTEEKSQRRSFDINIYRANLQLRELYPLFLRIYQHYSIPAEKFHALYNPVRTKTFGHLSGGIDREGKDFLSAYFGLEDIIRTE